MQRFYFPSLWSLFWNFLSLFQRCAYKQQKAGNTCRYRLMIAWPAKIVKSFKMILTPLFVLFKQVRLRASALSVLKTLRPAAFPDLGPAANHSLPALYASSGVAPRFHYRVRPAISERHFVCGHHHFFFFFLDTSASRSTFALCMQK